ncbi:hypothetical protein [Mesorhizobium sp. L-2-11]|nr:hypothetical protein [Mesorhizobium sp. L-2-11]
MAGSVAILASVNAPKAPDITRTIELLLAATEKLSQLAGAAVKQAK